MPSYELKPPFVKSAALLGSYVSVGNITELSIERLHDDEIAALTGALFLLRNYLSKAAIINISSSGILAFSAKDQAQLRFASGVTVHIRHISAYDQTDPGMINIMNGFPANRPPETKQQKKEAEEHAQRIRELL